MRLCHECIRLDAHIGQSGSDSLGHILLLQSIHIQIIHMQPDSIHDGLRIVLCGLYTLLLCHLLSCIGEIGIGICFLYQLGFDQRNITSGQAFQFLPILRAGQFLHDRKLAQYDLHAVFQLLRVVGIFLLECIHGPEASGNRFFGIVVIPFFLVFCYFLCGRRYRFLIPDAFRPDMLIQAPARILLILIGDQCLLHPCRIHLPYGFESADRKRLILIQLCRILRSLLRMLFIFLHQLMTRQTNCCRTFQFLNPSRCLQLFRGDRTRCLDLHIDLFFDRIQGVFQGFRNLRRKLCLLLLVYPSPDPGISAAVGALLHIRSRIQQAAFLPYLPQRIGIHFAHAIQLPGDLAVRLHMFYYRFVEHIRELLRIHPL